MLTRIQLRDFAVARDVEIALDSGMTVLTGETGAGKSILVDALGLLLGDRADRGVVRAGATRAELALEVDLGDLPAVRRWLADRDLDKEDECLLRRIVSHDGRSRGYVNGSQVPLATLRELGEQLVDIHGQNVHQSLLRGEVQRDLLDSHAGNDRRVRAFSLDYRRRKSLIRKIGELETGLRERSQRQALVRYQLEELESLAPGPNEYEALDVEQRRLAHAGALMDGLQEVCLSLYESEETSVYEAVAAQASRIEALAAHDAELQGPVGTFADLLEQIRDLASDLRRRLEGLESDPVRLTVVDERLAAMHELARKHRVEPAGLPSYRDRLQSELGALESESRELPALRSELESLNESLREQCRELGERRAKAAGKLARETSLAMQALGMRGAELKIETAPLGDQQISTSGCDRISFRVRTNPGTKYGPMNRILSGGELSRISLAIQMVAARDLKIPTLVFDEVDAGIGGAVAETVGRQLCALGTHRQVLCVTHLPQVAARADHHFRVHKHSNGETPSSRIEPLDRGQRVEEIARMLGGLKVTAQTRAHAAEMLAVDGS